jgi:hypothetical protein
MFEVVLQHDTLIIGERTFIVEVINEANPTYLHGFVG